MLSKKKKDRYSSCQIVFFNDDGQSFNAAVDLMHPIATQSADHVKSEEVPRKVKQNKCKMSHENKGEIRKLHKAIQHEETTTFHVTNILVA